VSKAQEPIGAMDAERQLIASAFAPPTGSNQSGAVICADLDRRPRGERLAAQLVIA
jgi:hypothetical protein